MPLLSGGAPARVLQLTRVHRLLLGLFVLVFLFSLVFAWITRDSMANLPFLREQRDAGQSNLVDIRPWQTAQQLSSLVVTAEEQQFAHEAEHLADHEVEDAFNAAVRRTQLPVNQRILSGKALALSQKIARLQKTVKEDQASVHSLTDSSSHTQKSDAGAAPDNTEDDELELAKEQLQLDSDELADAGKDLARETGDKRGQIQQELADYQAAVKKYDAQTTGKAAAAFATNHNYGGLVSRIGAFFNQRGRYQLLLDAAQESGSNAKTITALHANVEGQVDSKVPGSTDRAARLTAIRARSVRNQLLTVYDDQIQADQQLQDLYQRWAAQVQIQHAIVKHLVFSSLAWITFILSAAVILDALLRGFLSRNPKDRRTYSYRVITRLGLWAFAGVAMLAVLFGTPREMPTIVGLTTAGLTVVLQDFIISFCGWFVLIGKDGIRKGDWVEINGVGGEVAEIGVFRTMLLETGNWTDHGHPTGRRVAFANSFAIKGQYFNFTTGGQWMWDEITISVPDSTNVYANIDLIHKAVIEETQNESKTAEDEWHRQGLNEGLARFSATPAVNMRPTLNGIDVVMRYVTRASSRYLVRNQIYARVIELLHRPEATLLPEASTGGKSATQSSSP